MVRATVRRIAKATIAACALAFLAPGASQSEEIVLRTGTSWNERFPMAEMLALLNERLEAHSQGRMRMEIHLAKSLCSQKTCVEQVEGGLTDIGTASVSNYSGFYKTLEVLTLPYLFNDDAAAQAVIEDFLFDRLATVSAVRDGIRLLAIGPLLGFRHLESADGPVRTPADLRGVKIRVTQSPLDAALIRAWGAVATPIAWTDTLDALRRNDVRGLYVPRGVHSMMGFFELTPHVTLTGGAWTPMVIFMDQDRYVDLPAWAQTALDKASADLRAQVFEIDGRYAAELTAQNAERITYYTPTEAEMTRWRAAAARSWRVARQLRLYDPALARTILETQSGTEAFVAQLEAQGSL